MTLEFYQIVILISIGALVGISISFIGQTGLGIVLPIVKAKNSMIGNKTP